jgi:methyl-accepting chemotaxis protein
VADLQHGSKQMTTKLDEQIEKVFADIKGARDQIKSLTIAIEMRIEEVLDRGFDRKLKPADVMELEKLNNALGALQTSSSQLRIVTVRSLNELSEAKRLNNVFNAINDGLKRQQANIKKVATSIQNFAEAIGQVSQVIAGLGALITLL